LLLLILTTCLLVIQQRSRQRSSHSLNGLLASLDDGKGERGIAWDMSPPAAPTKTQLEAAEAIHQMGSNAIPELLRMLQTRDRSFLASFPRNIQQWWLNHFHGRMPQLLDDEHTPAARARHRAALGFLALGQSVRPAIDKLIPLFKDMDFSKEAALVLADSGAEGLVPLQEAITNTNTIGGNWQVLTAMWAMAQFPTNAPAVLPAALRGVTNSDVAVKYCSIFVLNRIQSEPEIEVQALTNCLSDPMVSGGALEAIRNYGTRATSAVPSLVGLLKSPTKRSEAARTLKMVAPQAAAEAGVKPD
jgi:hypothetical protein